jgi:hypothetical protein
MVDQCLAFSSGGKAVPRKWILRELGHPYWRPRMAQLSTRVQMLLLFFGGSGV